MTTMTIKKLGIAAAAIVALGGLLTFVADLFPKLATQGYTQGYVSAHARDNEAVQRTNDSTHVDFAGELKSTKELALENAITAAQARAGNFEVLAIRLRAEGAPPSDIRTVSDEARRSRGEASDFKDQLRTLRTK